MSEADYDIIIVLGEIFFDHPLSGAAILKRLLEKHGYSVGVVEMPTCEEEVKKLGKPGLFFAVSSGSIDSMVRNYTPLKKRRADDKNLDYNETVPDRAVIVYSNWIRRLFKGTPIVLGGTEAALRRFTHYDYWDNALRKSILFDTRADILAYGSAEKQIIEIASAIKAGRPLEAIPGTCIISKSIPAGFTELPTHEEVSASKERFCDMQNLLTNRRNLCQKTGDRYVLQFKSPLYTSKDLDEYYSLPFTREVPKALRGFQFSVATHRGCIGNCSFCSLMLMAGDKIISRSEESILAEIASIAKHPHFRGNIDDLGGPSANMYGMDCELSPSCEKDCIDCPKLDRSHKRILALMKKARAISGVKHIYIRSGIRYDLASDEYVQEIARHHVADTLRIAPEHVSKSVLKAMNKDRGDLARFTREFMAAAGKKELSYYFMAAHPGSTIKEAEELANAMAKLKNVEAVQVFTPTPMTISTCMYYTGLDPKTRQKIHIPYTYSEKKQQKRVIFEAIARKPQQSGRKEDQKEGAKEDGVGDDRLNSF
jgi:uncharacterized radical SAM protein YgiQ